MLICCKVSWDDVLFFGVQGDPQDDPRYFPLPKERKRSLDSSDEGLSSDDDLFNRKVQPVISKSESTKEKGRRGRQPKAGNAEKKRTKKEKDSKENDHKHGSGGKNSEYIVFCNKVIFIFIFYVVII